jgi:hypothetical protein
MRTTVVVRQILPLLLASTIASRVQAKDINIGWSGPGTWTTLPEYTAEKQGLRTLARPRDPEEHRQRRRRNRSVVARAALGESVLQEQRRYAVALCEKTLSFDHPSAEKFYSLLRERYNPERLRHRRFARGGDFSFQGKGQGGGQSAHREGLEFR